MSNEEIKLPIYDKEGKVRDERIARAMAEEELKYRDHIDKHKDELSLGEHNRGWIEFSAESKGLDKYLEGGVEITSSDVPEDIMELFRGQLGATVEIDNPEAVEFRKIDNGPEGASYFLNYDFQKDTSGNWSYARVGYELKSLGPVVRRNVDKGIS